LVADPITSLIPGLTDAIFGSPNSLCGADTNLIHGLTDAIFGSPNSLCGADKIWRLIIEKTIPVLACSTLFIN
jgi:hypothetical protein